MFLLVIWKLIKRLFWLVGGVVIGVLIGLIIASKVL